MDEALSDAARQVERNTTIGGRFNDNLRVSTGDLPDGKGSTAYGLEVLGLYRNAAVWAEYGNRRLKFVAGSPISHIHQTGWSASGGLFVTGETPPYSARTGTFTFPIVKRPVFDGGPGAIELVSRYEELDYSDAPQGGTGTALTLGANWYLHNWIRFTGNMIRWHTDNRVGPVIGPDTGETFLLRSQIVW
jgi:phosphate-selective porin OprO/OprP